MTVEAFNELPEAEAIAALLRCNGAQRWALGMAIGRPYRDAASLLARCGALEVSLSRAEWIEAFAHHPRIGDRADLAQRFPQTAILSSQEQSGVVAAGRDVLEQLLAGNRAYELRYGHIFIVCATGKTAAEMLALLMARMNNEPDAELVVAAAEHARITMIRLEKLLA